MIKEYAVIGTELNGKTILSLVLAPTVNRCMEIISVCSLIRETRHIIQVRDYTTLKTNESFIVGSKIMPSGISPENLVDINRAVQDIKDVFNGGSAKKESESVDIVDIVDISKVKKDIKTISECETGLSDILDVISDVAMFVVQNHKSDHTKSTDDIRQWQIINMINNICRLK